MQRRWRVVIYGSIPSFSRASDYQGHCNYVFDVKSLCSTPYWPFVAYELWQRNFNPEQVLEIILYGSIEHMLRDNWSWAWHAFWVWQDIVNFIGKVCGLPKYFHYFVKPIADVGVNIKSVTNQQMVVQCLKEKRKKKERKTGVNGRCDRKYGRSWKICVVWEYNKKVESKRQGVCFYIFSLAFIHY